MRESSAPLRIIHAGLVDYEIAREQQVLATQARVEGTGPDTLFLLEHPSVYTAGTRTQPEDLPTDGTPVITVDRGGRITWHGPGQLIAYPIVKLESAFNVVGYVRMLEQAIIATLRDLGLESGRIKGRSGVWFPADHRGPDRKVAAIGVRVAKGVTSHGIGLNCNADLSGFDRIVPCGISDAGVTSLSRELDRDVTVAEVAPIFAERLDQALSGRMEVKDETLQPRPAPALPGSVQWELGALNRA